MKTVLMSIKPKYSDLIFKGQKRFELRRTSVRMEEGDIVVVYASSPVKALVGAFVVAGVRRGPADDLWAALGEQFGVTRQEYDAYFAGADRVNAIEVGASARVTPIDLETLRQKFEGFRPPQSYMWWPDGVALLGTTGTKLASSVAT